MTTDTRTRLLEGTIQALREHGIAGVSARTIAAAAGVNQALVFYHFGSVDDLLAAACVWSTERQVAEYGEQFARVKSLRELAAVGRELQQQERAAGNVAMMGQLLAGAQTNPAIAAATRDAFRLWHVAIEAVLERVLVGSPLGEVAGVPGLARAIAGSFIGMELMAGVDPEGDELAFAAVDQLGALLEYLDELGPTTKRAVKAAVRRTVRKKAAAES